MNVLLWSLQIVLALHTIVGAAWKSSNSEHTMASLGAIPHGVWTGLTILDLLCAVGLISPAFNNKFAILVPIAAAVVGAEMLLFSGVHLATGSTNIGPVLYWLVVAGISAFIVYARLVHKPIRRREFA